MQKAYRIDFTPTDAEFEALANVQCVFISEYTAQVGLVSEIVDAGVWEDSKILNASVRVGKKLLYWFKCNSRIASSKIIYWLTLQ